MELQAEKKYNHLFDSYSSERSYSCAGYENCTAAVGLYFGQLKTEVEFVN